MILVFFTFESFLGHHIPALEFVESLAFSVLVSYKRVSYKKMIVCSIQFSGLPAHPGHAPGLQPSRGIVTIYCHLVPPRVAIHFFLA